MKTIFFLNLMGLLSFVNCHNKTVNTNMNKDNKVVVKLKIKHSNEKIMAVLRVENTGPINVYIDKLLIGYDAGPLSADVFVVESKGKEVDYNGLMVKRGKPDKDDFILLTTNKSIESSIDLTDNYAFVKNMVYTIRYQAIHQSPEDDSVLNELVSNTEEIKY